MICLVLLCFVGAAREADAEVLAKGLVVGEEPVTVVASASAYKPGRLALDVIPRPGTPVRVEWSVLCYGGPGPTTGGEFVTERPVHRRVELPPRPRGVCHFEAEATFVDSDRRGRIAVTLRGHVKKAPL